MRRSIYILAISLFALSSTAFGDVKIKSRQTMSGQSYENTTYIKGKRSRSETMNGMMINLTQCDLRRGIQINPNAKTYLVNPFDDGAQSAARSTAVTDKNGVVQAGGKVMMTITIKDTGERKQMFGFTARHLIITTEMQSSPDACSKTNMKMQADGWYIDAEFVLDCDYGVQSYGGYNRQAGSCRDRYETKTIGTAKRGYPVYEKTTMFDESGKETMSYINEVVELSKATLEASLFEVPADYREVQDASQMYAAASSDGTTAVAAPSTAGSGVASSIRNAAASSTSAQATTMSPKQAGVVRIGLTSVKTGAVGDGIAAADLAAAIQNTLTQFLKVPNVEVVTLDARLNSAIEAEATEKECDFVLYATVSHKKGGGGFGGFGSVLGSAVGRVGLGGFGNTAANVAGQVATQAVVTATSMSANVKSKDEITLDIKLNRAGTAALANIYKAKAKSNGEDIITKVVEQAAQVIVDSLGK
ncbi:MAG TPA: hypothetical protein VJL58_11085 [Pyrinomonadaceae bacterium]|nr:hypothetical protein [Pyrinomonadaceae bacterium]